MATACVPVWSVETRGGLTRHVCCIVVCTGRSVTSQLDLTYSSDLITPIARACGRGLGRLRPIRIGVGSKTHCGRFWALDRANPTLRFRGFAASRLRVRLCRPSSMAYTGEVAVGWGRHQGPR